MNLSLPTSAVELIDRLAHEQHLNRSLFVLKLIEKELAGAIDGQIQNKNC